MHEDFIECGDGAACEWEDFKNGDKSDISFSEAVQLVRAFWNQSDIESIYHKIVKEYRPTSEYMIMVGGSVKIQEKSKVESEVVQRTEEEESKFNSWLIYYKISSKIEKQVHSEPNEANERYALLGNTCAKILFHKGLVFKQQGGSSWVDECVNEAKKDTKTPPEKEQLDEDESNEEIQFDNDDYKTALNEMNKIKNFLAK